jgi:PAS domain S-box-containing protein
MNTIPVVDFKSLFEKLPGLYLVLTPGFTIVAVSDAYLLATMTERKAIIGHDLFEIFPANPDDKGANGVSNLRASLNAVLQFGQPHKMAEQKYDIRKPDGVFEERYWSPLNSPVFNEAQELVYIIHKVTDVTDQQRASQKLKKSEKDYQLLVSSVKDYAIFMVDPNGLVASWNSGAERIKGYTANEIIGKPINVFYTDEDIKQGVPHTNLQLALQHGHFEVEGRRLRKDGTIFWANIVISALKDEAGLLYGYSKITRDITERKNVLQQLESLSWQVNQSNDSIYTTDINRKIKSWNRGAEKIYGYSAEEMMGKEPNAILKTILTEAQMNAKVKEVAEKGYLTDELQRTTKAGAVIWVQSSLSCIRDDKGAITGYLAVSYDISDRKKVEEKLKEFEYFFNNSNDLSCIANTDGYFEFINPSFNKVLG